jgi:hypothetical protein
LEEPYQAILSHGSRDPIHGLLSEFFAQQTISGLQEFVNSCGFFSPRVQCFEIRIPLNG